MKSSILNEKNTKYLIFESEECDFSDNTARGMLLNNTIDGVLPFTFSGFDKVQTVRYDISEMTPVSEILINDPGRAEIFRIIKAAAVCCKKTEEYLIERSSIVLSTDRVFINKADDTIHFVVLPFSNSISPDIKDFIKTLLFSIRFEENENCSYVGKIINYLNINDFDPEELISLCEDQSVYNTFPYDTHKTDNGDSSTIYVPENHRNDFSLSQDKKIQNNNEITSSSFSSAHIKSENTFGFKIPLDKYADEEKEDKTKRSIFSKIFEKSRSSYEERMCDEYGEIIDEYHSSECYPFLLRVKNNEKITITGSIFKIGTDYNAVDYCIYDNKAVSRVHASIKNKNRYYYITDEKSTNHTFLNERKIRDGIPSKIEDKSKIRLGDEEFIFYCR